MMTVWVLCKSNYIKQIRAFLPVLSRYFSGTPVCSFRFLPFITAVCECLACEDPQGIPSPVSCVPGKGSELTATRCCWVNDMEPIKAEMQPVKQHEGGTA